MAIKEKNTSIQKSEITMADWEKHGPIHINVNGDKFILDYLINEGFASVGNSFADEKGFGIGRNHFLNTRENVRDCIEKGDIDRAISYINNINIGILDSDIEFYFYLVKHKALEMIAKLHQKGSLEENFETTENILGFIDKQISDIANNSPELKAHFEELMVFFIFKKGEPIHVRRKDLAIYANQKIMANARYEVDELNCMIEMMMKDEEILGERFHFPKFETQCNQYNIFE